MADAKKKAAPEALPWDGRRPLSYSSMSMYRECPRKYKFKYVDRIPEKPKYFFSYGRSIHDALEFFYNPELMVAPTVEELVKYFHDHWVSEGYRDGAQENEKREEGEVLLREFHAKHEPGWAPPFHAEYGFNVVVGGVPVTGKVDRIDRLEDGSVSILDYKTGKTFKKGRIEEDQQLSMYQMCCEQALEVKVGELVLYHLPSLTEHKVGRRPGKQIDALTKQVRSTAQNILDAAFEPTPSENACRWCDYQALCPVFSDEAPRRQAQGRAPRPSEPAALPAADPAPTAQSVRTFGAGDNVKDRIAGLIDRLGELEEQKARIEPEARRLREELEALLRENRYVRAFGKNHQVVLNSTLAWTFPDKEKFLRAVKDLGLYDRILIPGAQKVHALLDDPKLGERERETLRALARKAERGALEIKRLES